MGFGDRETVDDGVIDVLLLHGLQHVWDDCLPSGVVKQELLGVAAAGDDCSTLLGQLLLVGLGVVVVLVAHEALAVTDEPYLTSQTAEDDGRRREPVFGVCGKTGQLPPPVVFADVGADPRAELVAAEVPGGMAQVVTDEPHGVAAVAAEEGVPV